MTRKKIVDTLAVQYALPKTVVDGMICSLIDLVCGSLSHGEDVAIRGFGRFTTRTAKAKKGHDFKTGGIVEIKERRIPVFRFARKRVDELNWN